MADEFVKGFGILSGAGLLWLILAGIYRTPTFEGPQMTAPLPEDLSTFDMLAVVLMETMFWFMIFGTLVFWVVIPTVRGARTYYENRETQAS